MDECPQGTRHIQVTHNQIVHFFQESPAISDLRDSLLACLSGFTLTSMLFCFCTTGLGTFCTSEILPTHEVKWLKISDR